MFITFEGPEGAGKTTQLGLLRDRLESDGWNVLTTFEPGGTPVGDAIRQILLASDRDSGPVARAEVLLFAAARAQLVDQVIAPALRRGYIVLCDRYNDSTLAYQVGGRGLRRDQVEKVTRFATGGLVPDLTFLLDLDVRAGLARKRSTTVDRMEREELSFHERVRAEYLALARSEPGRIVVLDATRPIDELAAVITRRVIEKLRDAG